MTDEKIRKYFLGELSTVETENFEEMLVFDGILFGQAEVVESELIDDFLQKRLSSSERHSFEEKYLTTEARRKKLKSAENFFQFLRETSSAVIADKTKKNFGNTLLAGFSFPKFLFMESAQSC